MKKPRLLNLAAAVSLLLCVATGVLWARSYVKGDDISYRILDVPKFHATTWAIQSAEGQIVLAYDQYDLETAAETAMVARGGNFIPGISHLSRKQLGDFPRSDFPPLLPAQSPFLRRLGFGRLFLDIPGRHAHLSQSPHIVRDLMFPYWAIPSLLLLSIVPWIWIHSTARRRRAEGLCPTCGYDLRATPAKSGPLFDRCPECGTLAEMRNAEC